jgi:transcriptional antiterminator RfaH
MLDVQPHSRLDACQRDVIHRSDVSPAAAVQGWAVFTTHPNTEDQAENHLTQQGFEAYCPRYTCRRRIGTTLQPVARPLFPRYAFVWLSNTPWHSILYTTGVSDLLRSPQCKPYIAPEAAVSALQATEALRRTLPPGKPLWRLGDACTLAGGPFAGHPAVISEIGKHTALVAMMLFGQLRNMAVPLDNLVARESGSPAG